MEITPSAIHAFQIVASGMNAFSAPPAAPQRPDWNEKTGELEEKFQEFVAGTFFRTLLKSLRQTVHETKLIHGGKAEEIFREQLDQTISQQLADSHGGGVADEMFVQFQLMMNRASTGIFEPEVQPLDERRTSRTITGTVTDDAG